MADDDSVQRALDQLYRGQTVLGHDISLGPTGASSLPAGSPTGLPAPSGVGGTGGFMGGVGGPGMQGRPANVAGLLETGAKGAKQLSDLFAEKDLGMRGGTGGQSLSDQLRSQLGGVPPGAAGFGATPEGQVTIGPITTEGFAGPPVPGPKLTPDGTTVVDQTYTNQFGGPMTPDMQAIEALQTAGFTPDEIQNMMGITNPAAGFGAGEIPAGESIVSGAAGGVSDLGVGAAGGLGGALVGALPGLIGKAAGVDPQTGVILDAAGKVIGQVAAPVAAGAASGLASGGLAGAAAGAGAGLSGSLAALPVLGVTAGFIGAQTAGMLESMSAAKKLEDRLKNIYGQLPGELGNMLQVPGIASQLTPNSSPEKAADVLSKLNDFYKQFQGGGWEAYMKQGGTLVRGGSNAPDVGADLTGVQQELQQYANAVFPQMDAAMVRAQDILTKAGWTPEQIEAKTGRYVPPEAWAQQLGSPEFNAAFRPSALQPNFQSQGDPSAPLDPAFAASLGLPPGTTVGDWINYQASGAGAGKTTTTPYGDVNTALLQQIQGFQPGGMEAGLRTLLEPYGGLGPSFGAWGASPAESATVTGALDSLGAGGALSAGELSEAQKRAMGVLA